ncbi:MAG TPA: hypothetical protein VHR66_32990 [Gemmataceae bacterium]|nr:hypothetical protein [Gemmataceae bacterium]
MSRKKRGRSKAHRQADQPKAISFSDSQGTPAACGGSTGQAQYLSPAIVQLDTVANTPLMSGGREILELQRLYYETEKLRRETRPFFRQPQMVLSIVTAVALIITVLFQVATSTVNFQVQKIETEMLVHRKQEEVKDLEKRLSDKEVALAAVERRNQELFERLARFESRHGYLIKLLETALERSEPEKNISPFILGMSIRGESARIYKEITGRYGVEHDGGTYEGFPGDFFSAIGVANSDIVANRASEISDYVFIDGQPGDMTSEELNKLRYRIPTIDQYDRKLPPVK